MKVSKKVLKKVYKKRNNWCHKGNYGRVVVVGGSKFYSGSPAFNALAAYRAGADLVTIVGPQCIADSVRSFAPDIIFYPYNEEFFSMDNVETVLDIIETADAVVIGGGLTRGSETKKAVGRIIKKVKKPIVIDADAIYSVKEKLNKNCILTPHTYEFFVLTGKEIDNKLSDRIKLAKDAARRFACTVLLKGHVDVISDGKRTVTNNTGSCYMTKGGFGDTLAGICGALLARTNNVFDAACAAAYVNGKAGELAAKKKESTMASDLIDKISDVIK